MTFTTIIYAVLMFCVLVFVHELGHFVAAKSFHVKVNKFALGMGPVLLKKTTGRHRVFFACISHRWILCHGRGG